MKNKKRPIIAIIVLLACAVGYYFYNQSVQQTAALNSGVLSLSGNVDVREVSMAFRSSDRISEILAEEGDSVYAGQVLAKLDTAELKLQTNKIKSQIAAQETVVLRLKNGTRGEEIAQAAARLEAAQADAAYAAQELSRKTTAFQTSAGRSVSQQDIDAAQAKQRSANARVNECQQAYQLAAAGPRYEDIAEAEAQLQVLKDELARQEYLLSQAELTAPVNSVVRSRLLEPGDMASPQTPVFKLALNDKKWVRAYINETDLGRIFEGQSAAVYIDSYPDRAVTGQVGYISSTAEFTPKTVQTAELRTDLVYEIRVYVDDADNILRMGMPATVKIKI